MSAFQGYSTSKNREELLGAKSDVYGGYSKTLIGLKFITRKCCMWPLVPKFTDSNPAEAFGFLGRKNP